MRLSTRDAQIIRYVARFRQLSTSQIARLVFHENKSDEPHKRVLLRLSENKVLHRVERRMVGGSGSGSGQYVYSLGVNGFRFLVPRGGKFTPARTVNYHSLSIGEAYVRLVEAERTGAIEIRRYAVESRDIEINGVEIRPDLEVEYLRWGERQHLWAEIDLGTEDTRQLREKIERIITAREAAGVYENADGSRYVVEPVPFPRVVFIVEDDYRREELRYVLRRVPEAGGTFSVVLAEDWPRHIL